jgi:hypothetical protein
MNDKKNASKKSASSTAPARAPVVPTPIPQPVIDQCSSLIGQVGELLGPGPKLTARDIQQSLKLRKGGAQLVTQLAALCKQHGVTSFGPAAADTMVASKARADALNEIGGHFDAAKKQLSDATFTAESTTWQHATALYTMLRRLSSFDPALKLGLQPMQEFFQTKATKGQVRQKQQKATAKKGQVAEVKLAAGANGATAPHATDAPTPTPPTPAPAAGVQAPAPVLEAAAPAANGNGH